MINLKACILALSIGLYRIEGAEVPRIDVWIDDAIIPPRILEMHKSLVSSLFAEIGVGIQWHALDDRRHEAAPGFEIRIVRQASKQATEGAMASTRISGFAITVFEDRVRQRVDQSYPAVTLVLLGHVIAHELAHAIQGIPRHSDSGILKAEWTDDDLTAMMFQKLKFSDFDALLIRQRAALSSAGRRQFEQAEVGLE